MSEAFDTLMDDGQPFVENVKKRGSWTPHHYKRVDLDFTNIRAVMSEPKCKICSHPDRKQADIFIYRQKMKDVNDDGEPFTANYLLTALAEMGIPNPSKENVLNHWRKHVEVPTKGQRAIERKAVSTILEKMSSDQILTMSRAELLDLMMRQGVLEAGHRLATTGKSGITVADVLKIAELQIREKGSEAQNEFLKALGGGIVAAVKNGIPAKQAKQLANAEVVDADVVEVEDPIEAAA